MSEPVDRLGFRLDGAYNLSRNTRDRERWTAEEWLKLYDAYEACGWDYAPCQWAAWQVEDVLKRGLVPQFDYTGPLPSRVP